MKIKGIIGTIILSIFVSAIFASAEMTAFNIMKKTTEVDTSQTQKSTMKMELIDKNGSIRERTRARLAKNVPEGKKLLVTFLGPADIAGTGFLSFEYDEPGKPDDQWLYLTSLGRDRQISAADKGEYFMGTQFTYDDQGERNPNDDTHQFKDKFFSKRNLKKGIK